MRPLSSFVLVLRGAAPLALVSSLLGCSSNAPPTGAAPSDAGMPDAAGDAATSLDDPPIPARFQAFATAFDQERQSLGAPGAAVAILENGQVTFFHGFGTRSATDATPVRGRTLFRIGSMTKALTATTFMRFVDQGKVSLDDILPNILPDVSLTSSLRASVTMRDLLSQQSGLYDYFAASGPSDDSALASFLTGPSFAQDVYFMDPPGTFWDYANTNYYLAGLAIERLGGATYRDAVTQGVLAPLGMTRTFFLPSDVLADGDYADGLSKNTDGSPLVEAPDAYDNAWARPAGFAFSSVLDYAKLMQFLLAGNSAVLSDAQRVAMQSAQVDMRDLGDIEGYGLGLVVDQGFNLPSGYYAQKLVWHDGDIPGFASSFYMVPSTGFGVVALASADDAHFSTSILNALESFAAVSNPGTAPTGVAPDPTTFPSIAGTYDDPHDVGAVTVTASASGLTISIPAADAASIVYSPTLTPASIDNFSLSIDGTTLLVTFFRDATGAYAWLRTRTFVAERGALGDGGAPGDGGPPAGDAGTDASGDAGVAAAARSFDARAFRARLHAPM